MKQTLTILFLSFIMTNFASSQSNWHTYFMGFPNHLNAVCFPSQSTGYVFGHEIMYKSTDAGNTWVHTPMPYKFIKADFVNENTGYALAQSSSQEDTVVVLKTTNGSTTWSSYRLDKRTNYQKIQFVNESTGYVFSENFIYRTTNGGIVWIFYNQNISHVSDWDEYNNLIWYVKTDHSPFVYKSVEVYRSSNYGVSFHSAGIKRDPNSNLYSGGIKMLNETTGYITYGTGPNSPGPRVSKTTNGGYNLTEISTNGGGHRLHMINSNIVFGFTRIYSFYNTSLRKTTNSCVNWTSQLFTEAMYDITFINELTGFMVGEYGVMLKTTNGGAPVSIENISTEIPDRFELSQNFPNPFNPTTMIKFTIPKNSNVKLSIYDITGKEISTLVNEHLTAGTYQYYFDGSKLNSGVYIYRLNNDDTYQTRKMVLLK